MMTLLHIAFCFFFASFFLRGYADEMDFCSSSPCQNGGICISELSACDCTGTGFTGDVCQTRIICASGEIDNARWPKANGETRVYGACTAGYIGQPSRMCQADGTWGELLTVCYSASNTCSSQSYANADWPATLVSTVSIGTCALGYSGNPTRRCMIDGTWSTALATYCQRNQCGATTEGNVDWPSTSSLVIVKGTCKTGYYGSIQRMCQADGTWGSITGSCQLATVPCPAETYAKANWTSTPAGQTATGTCTAGFEGSPTRICSSSGAWQTLVSNGCTRIQCPATSITISPGVTITYPASLSNTNVAGVCPQGLTGKPYRFCDLNGNWASNVVGLCK